MSLVKPLIDHAAAELAKRDVNWEEFSVIWSIDKEGEANNSWGC